MSTSLTIAIDGPAGTGKSSVSKGLARALGARYLDTGAMYRIMTLHMLRAGVDVTDPDAIAAASSDVPLSVGLRPRRGSLFPWGRGCFAVDPWRRGDPCRVGGVRRSGGASAAGATAATARRGRGQRGGGGPRHRHGGVAGRGREVLPDGVGGDACASAQRPEHRQRVRGRLRRRAGRCAPSRSPGFDACGVPSPSGGRRDRRRHQRHDRGAKWLRTWSTSSNSGRGRCDE